MIVTDKDLAFTSKSFDDNCVVGCFEHQPNTAGGTGEVERITTLSYLYLQNLLRRTLRNSLNMYISCKESLTIWQFKVQNGNHSKFLLVWKWGKKRTSTAKPTSGRNDRGLSLAEKFHKTIRRKKHPKNSRRKRRMYCRKRKKSSKWKTGSHSTNSVRYCLKIKT